MLHFGAVSVAKASEKPTKVTQTANNRNGRHPASEKHIPLIFNKIRNSRFTIFRTAGF
jgi:hypothetical protein